jgi:hypothetical protein
VNGNYIKIGDGKMKLLARCDYCQYESIEDKVVLHEKDCLYNPKNKTCMTCSNNIITEVDRVIFEKCKLKLLKEKRELETWIKYNDNCKEWKFR